ncbi:MAG: tetratricopeptide repeat protein [Alphaproteobacteria bacterium]|nr:tetratricopeptide repeat protein [Alphaproteobacteria bacterium]
MTPFDRALEHHMAGRLTEAETLYAELLKTDPGHVEGLHLLGVIQHQRGRHEAAVMLIGEAVRLKPDYADAHSNLGAALRALCLLKTPKGPESVEFFAPPPYRRGHDHASVRLRFSALVPGPQPRLAGARARRPSTSGWRPATATPWSASAPLRRPVALGLALPNLAADPQRHGPGQTGNRDQLAS